MTDHAINRAYERCIPAAFGIHPESAISKAKFWATKFDCALLVLAHSERIVKVGNANGNNLCAVVRDGQVQTFLSRRDGKSSKL